MKIIRFDGGFRYDDPNNRWGNPSYQLEPGDEGYVPPSPVPSQPPTKKKHMKRNSYYPGRVGDQIVWLTNFPDKIVRWATVLGLTPAQVAAAQADCRWLVYVLREWLPAARAWSLACTNAAYEIQSGTGTAAQTLPVFVPPPHAEDVAPVAPGALDRIFALVQLIKDSGKCTDVIAADLGILGSAATGPNLAAVQPDFTATVVSGQVFLKWGWGGNADYLEFIEFLVDRADGKGSVFLATDTTPGYTDTTPLPATLTKWTYKAIYHDGDHQVGLWSVPVTVNVQKE